MQPDVSVIVVSWNTRDLLTECIASVVDTAGGLDVEMIVVDNGSSDGSQDMVRQKFPDVRLVANTENVGFARANNQAMADARGRYFLLLNSDAVALPNALRALVDLGDGEPRAGIVGATLLNTDGSFQFSHTAFPNLWQEFLVLSGLGRLVSGPWYPSRGPEERAEPEVVDYVQGACLLVRRRAYQEVGGFDTAYFMYAEEVDWCYAMREAGWEVWHEPRARITHHGGASSRRHRTQREADLYTSRVRFFRKRYGWTAADALAAMMLCMTAVKVVTHGALRRVSGNRLGRPVVGLRELADALRSV
jgi:GT2 family glycosyltransferase